MYKYLFLLSIFISTTSFADFENLPIKCFPKHGTKNTTANIVFQTSFSINESTHKHPNTDNAVIYGMKWENEKKKKDAIIDETKACRIVADMKIFKRMESEEILQNEFYHFSTYYPANTNGKHPLQLVFRHGLLDPNRIFLECDELDETATADQIEEAIGHVAKITFGEKTSVTDCQ
jgi:hypothetical protein